MPFLITLLFSLFGLLSGVAQQAKPGPSVRTEYTSDRLYLSVCSVPVAAPPVIVTRVTDDLIREFTHNPNQLFDWAFKGLGLQGEGKDLVILTVNHYNYNTRSGIYEGNFDFTFPRVIAFRDISITALICSKSGPGQNSEVSLELQSTNMIVRKAGGSLRVIPQPKGCLMVLQVHTRFSWFMDLLVTPHKYKTILDWRMAAFLENLRAEAEKRANTAPKS